MARYTSREAKQTYNSCRYLSRFITSNQPIGDLIGISFHHDLETGLTPDSITYRVWRKRWRFYLTQQLWRQRIFNVKSGLWFCNWRIKNQLDATCYFVVLPYKLNMFRALLCPSSGARDYDVDYHIGLSFLVFCRLEFRCGYAEVVCGLQLGHYSSLTAPNLRHTANQERKDQCGNQHHSRELLMMGIVKPETCRVSKKYNKITSGI